MGDYMVQLSQMWVNATYRNVPGYVVIPEDGTTGWQTMYALTRALQHELGITVLSSNFGAGTLSALTSRNPIVNASTTNANVIKIVQAGLWCKGYSGSGSTNAVSGTYDESTRSSIETLKSHMGVSSFYSATGVTPKMFRSLLTMDPYVLASGGTAAVRTAQQWLNGRYIGRRDFYIVPCQGIFSRETQKALMLGIQFELGMSDDVATGTFGPTTQQLLRDGAGLRLGMNDTTRSFVRLFQAAMNFNSYSAPFNGTFDSATVQLVRSFQAFAALQPVNGEGDFQTWASLLVSTGDPARAVTACDTATTLTSARAAALWSSGYRIVGRYLTNAASSTLNKMIQPGEIAATQSAGLSLFPIYQTYGGSASYFGPTQGATDARAAIAAARYHGFPQGTIIYFAVDFDALDAGVKAAVVPHFKSIHGETVRYGADYRVGIYGPRNACSQVAAAGYSESSFVSGMSTGFSGNLGFPLPSDWAFDQIATITVGTGTASVVVDKVVAGGRNLGVRGIPITLRDPVPDELLSPAQGSSLQADLVAYLTRIGQPSPVSANLSRESAASVVVGFDSWVTTLSNLYGIRKALIQAPVLWETRGRSAEDVAFDALLYAYYRSRAEYDQGLISIQPIAPGGKTDSSTGIGAIFGKTAISSFNAALAQGLGTPMVDRYNASRTFDTYGRSGRPLQRRPYDAAAWTDVRDMWMALYNSNEFSIGMAALVLLENADKADPPIRPRAQLSYSPENLTQIIQLYNGTGQNAADFGVWVGGIYTVFEKYYGPARTL